MESELYRIQHHREVCKQDVDQLTKQGTRQLEGELAQNADEKDLLARPP